jgi:sec-independent protein translocase protein TatB
MFDFAWSELMVIGAVALVVIGPKDLPKALKTAGILLRRARGMAREFQNSIDDMIREADLDDVRKTVQDATRFDLEKTIHGTIDPGGVLKQPLLPDWAGPDTPATGTVVPTAPEPANPPEPPPTANAPVESPASDAPVHPSAP